MPHRCRLHVESYKRVNALSCLRRLTIKGHVDSTVVVRCIKRQMKRLHSIATWSHSRERTRPASRLFNLFSLGSFKCGRERRAEKKEPFDQFILSVPRARRCRFCGVSVGCCHLRVTYIYIYDCTPHVLKCTIRICPSRIPYIHHARQICYKHVNVSYVILWSFSSAFILHC